MKDDNKERQASNEKASSFHSSMFDDLDVVVKEDDMKSFVGGAGLHELKQAESLLKQAESAHDSTQQFQLYGEAAHDFDLAGNEFHSDGDRQEA